MRKKLPLNAFFLRMLALALMLCDHLWATIVPGNDWMTFIGRLAFPIFAFQIAEGYFHTSDFKRYTRRLLIFALISEIPFNLMMGSSLFYPFRQNVMFTLLLGLHGVRAVDRAKENGGWIRALLMVLLVTAVGGITFVDYGAPGVLTVIAFGALRHTKLEKPGQIAAMVLLHWVFMEGRVFPVGGMEIPEQALAIFALLPIWLYNGEKGPGSKALQMGSYVFYPAHMLILHLIRTFW